MASIQSLTEEYHQYIEERKALAAIGAAGAIAIGGAHFMNKDAQAATGPEVSGDHRWGDGDWAFQGDEKPDPEIQDEPEEEEDDEDEPQGGEVDYDREDVDVLSMTLWGEARGEGESGMRAVAHVIVNRARHNRWSDTISGVARQDRQFSCWNDDDVNSELMPKMLEFYNYLKHKPDGWKEWYEEFKRSPDYPGFQKYLEARQIARDVLENQDDDPTNGAVFYHTSAISPYWARGQQVVARIGAHQFYRTDAKA